MKLFHKFVELKKMTAYSVEAIFGILAFMFLVE